jgi:hypothetical protein
MKTEWVQEAGKIASLAYGDHVESGCRVVPSPATSSYWLGQFSPAITNRSAVRMDGVKPYAIGTPPYGKVHFRHSAGPRELRLQADQHAGHHKLGAFRRVRRRETKSCSYMCAVRCVLYAEGCVMCAVYYC